MAPAHGLSFLKVGVAGHDDVDFLLGSGHGRFEEVREMGLEEPEFVTEPPACWAKLQMLSWMNNERLGR